VNKHNKVFQLIKRDANEPGFCVVFVPAPNVPHALFNPCARPPDRLSPVWQEAEQPFLGPCFLIMTGTLDPLPAKSGYKAASPINERRLRMTLPRLIRSRMTLLTSLILIMVCSVWPESVQAGCNINIFFANKSKHTIRIYEGKVKVRGGLWKKMKYWDPAQSEMRLNPGKRSGDGYRADFNCGAKRRYQVKYQCLGGTGGWFTDYYPSAKKWTTNQTIT